MSTPQNPQDPAGAPTDKLAAQGSAEEAASHPGRRGLSEQTQKALLAVTSGLALILSVIALVVALAGADGHHGRGDGPMHGGPRMGMERHGGPMGGPQGGPPPGAYNDQGPGQQGGPDGGDRRDGGGATTAPERNQ